MDNHKTPAAPITDQEGMPFNSLPGELATLGLTKGEVFAAVAMHAMLVADKLHYSYIPERAAAVGYSTLAEVDSQ